MLRQVSKIFAKNMCKYAPRHLCTCILLPFLSFSLWVLLKINITAIKRNHKGPIIELQSNVCGKHPFGVLRESKGRCPARTPRLQEFWWKEIPIQSCLNDGCAVGQRWGNDQEAWEADWQAGGVSGWGWVVEDQGQRRLGRGADTLLKPTSYSKFPYFKQVFKKLKERQLSASCFRDLVLNN